MQRGEEEETPNPDLNIEINATPDFNHVTGKKKPTKKKKKVKVKDRLEIGTFDDGLP